MHNHLHTLQTIGDDTVSVIDTATNTVTATIPVGHEPFGVAVHPDGSTVYVTNSGDGTISVIDTATNTVITTITVGGDILYGIAATPDGSTLYVANAYGSIAVIDTATNKVIDTILGEYPYLWVLQFIQTVQLFM